MTDTSAANTVHDLARTFFTFFDRPAYWLLGIMYQIFFNVASADLFNNATILGFYKRVQLIIGVFMIFQLAVTILKGIMNPDEAFGAKSGIGTIITRVVLALVLLTVLVPVSIPGATTEYERQINNNGLLFGTLYSLQHRILSNNTLGRLVLGTTDTGDSADSSNTGLSGADKQAEELARSSRIFTSTILKGFVRINLVPEEYRVDPGEGKTEDMINDNRICKDIDDAVLEAYTKIDADPGEILGLINANCTPSNSDNWLQSDLEKSKRNFLTNIFGKKRYVFAHMPIISAIVAFVFVFILVSFTVEVAVRAIKLAILRLIAPIPIISYMDPKGGKDGAFSAWVKALTSTYIDLFLRLAIIYFVIYLIQDMIVNGVVMNTGSGMIGILSVIAIWIGLFMFAKEAPKFIKQVLGMKEDKTGNGIFSGLGRLAGLGAATAGSIGAGIAAGRASAMADKTRQSIDPSINPDSLGNKAKHILSGITGGVAGFGTGATAAMTAKDHAFRNSMEAMRKRNASVISRGDNGSTLFGRLESTASNVLMGEGSADATARIIETNKGRIDALKAIKSRVSGEMVKKDWTSGNLGIATDNAGNAIGKVNFKAFEANLAAARSRGDGLVHFKDVRGTTHTISLDDAEKQRGFLLRNNEDDYIVQHVSGTVTAANVDDRLMTLIHNAEVLGGSSDFTRNPDGTIKKEDNKPITNRSSINDAIEGFEDYNTQLTRQNAINKANDSFAGKQK